MCVFVILHNRSVLCFLLYFEFAPEFLCFCVLLVIDFINALFICLGGSLKLESRHDIDAHLIAGFLKTFIRDLKNSLLVGSLSACWMEAIGKSNKLTAFFFRSRSFLYVCEYVLNR